MDTKKVFLIVIIALFLFCACSSEEKNFQKAKQANNISDYQNFIKEYPSGKYSITAKNILDSLYFQSVLTANSPDKFREFIKNHPESKYLSIANDRIDNLLNKIQIFKNKYKIKITGLKKDKVWIPMPNFPDSPKVTPRPGADLIIISFDVIDLATGNQVYDGFEDFFLEDSEGKKYNCQVLKTDVHNIGIGVTKGVKLKYFLMSGLKFDIEQLAGELK